jgi:uncharacterized coiled-coil protein SlyX
MKGRLGLIFSIALIITIPALTSAKQGGKKPENRDVDPLEMMQIPDQPQSHDNNLQKDANDLQDRIKKYKGLDAQLHVLEKSADTTVKQWADIKSENQTKSLIDHTYQHLEKELMLFRKLAAAENANKTVTAIDAVILQRKKQLKQITEQLEKRATDAKHHRSRRTDPESATTTTKRERKTRDEIREERRKAFEERRNRKKPASGQTYD